MAMAAPGTSHDRRASSMRASTAAGSNGRARAAVADARGTRKRANGKNHFWGIKLISHTLSASGNIGADQEAGKRRPNGCQHRGKQETSKGQRRKRVITFPWLVLSPWVARPVRSEGRGLDQGQGRSATP